MNAPKISTKPPSGMRDFLPADIARRQHVIDVVRRIYGSYGFVPLETPAIENLSTLLGKYGEEGDQLLYRLLHRRDALHRGLEAGAKLVADLPDEARGPAGEDANREARADVRLYESQLSDQGLRYDLTVPLARVAAQYDLPKYFKRYQIQPVWRADRPGKGRFREFYQCDVDVTGTSSLVAEAEVCGAVAEVLHALGFTDFKIRVNHRQLLRAMMHHAGIDVAHEAAALVAIDKLDKVGHGGVLEELATRGITTEAANKLMMLVLTADGEQLFGFDLNQIAEGPKTPIKRVRKQITDELGLKALADLEELFDLLAATPAGPHIQLSLDLARGLGYYTGSIFEIAVPDLAGSLGGGGRYDNLVGMFGKKQVPAVGFSLGLERILVVMEERGMFPNLSIGPDVLLCWMEGTPRVEALRVAHSLRRQGVKVEVFPEEAKLGKQLQYADTPGVKAPVAAIVGGEELKAGQVTLKHLASGTQERVALEGAGEAVRALLRQ